MPADVLTTEKTPLWTRNFVTVATVIFRGGSFLWMIPFTSVFLKGSQGVP